MPSQRAILADITDKGLSPNKPHKVVGTDGRLRPTVVAAPGVEPEPDTEPTVEKVPPTPEVEIPVLLPPPPMAMVEEEVVEPKKVSAIKKKSKTASKRSSRDPKEGS